MGMASRHATSLLELKLLLIWLASATAAPVNPGCRDTCGNVSIPFPFGIGDGCHIGGGENKWFNVTCDESFNPPKPYWGDGFEVFEISLQGQLTVRSPIHRTCQNLTVDHSRGERDLNLDFEILPDDAPTKNLPADAPFTLSDTRNTLIAVGCYFEVRLYPSEGGCTSACWDMEMVAKNSGIGWCQAVIPSGMKNIVDIYLTPYSSNNGNDDSIRKLKQCGYAFIVEKGQFAFSPSDLDPSLNSALNNPDTRLPVVIDWTIKNQTCKSAQGDAEDAFACRSENNFCYDSSLGYRCSCKEGFRGNPYLKGPGSCQDVNECNENRHSCSAAQRCENREGGYMCKNKPDPIMILLGIGVCFLFMFILVSSWVYWGLKKRQFKNLREKFFRKNGGLLLQQQIASYGITVATRIFSAKELDRATNKYDETRIIGRGGYGTVYKGILPDHGTVAIKKSKVVDENQIEQFINEVFILSQINHRNVVKLLGCCLETQVPLLVYEFISNGTLSNHIHDEAHQSSLSLENRLRIASETAGALSYLHFAASMPIFHRDVKSANILLDDTLTAKVADFGASRLIPLDQTQISTIVQGTLGYLDPEYIQTGQLTEKSDVYSFGVVLVELLTGDEPTSLLRSPEERNLSMYFLTSMKENRLFNVLDCRVVDEGGVEQLSAVAQLAKRCLSVKGEERPTMKEVAMELEGLRRFTQHP